MPNPIIQHKFTADPTVIVYDDNWKEHPHPLKPTDFSWASGDAYASKVIHAHNKFYWYVAVSHAHIEGKAIGVAESVVPMGPFKDALGSALITHDMLPEPAGEKATYFFYHNGGLPEGASHRRSVCIDRLFYNKDGTMKRVIMTSEGISAI